MLKHLRNNLDLVILILVTLPIWQWLLVRYVDSSDESFGWIPLFFLLSLVIKTKKVQYLNYKDFCIASIFLIIYTVFYQQIPPLARGVIIMSAMAILISRRVNNHNCFLAIWGLSVLSLPITATMQFFIGFPLRMISSQFAGLLLSTAGMQVSVNGGIIKLNNLAVSIDAPCSGVKMLYVTALTVTIISTINRFKTVKTLILSLIGLIVLIIVNSIRSTLLFLTESKLLLPNHTELIHTLSGIMIFIVILFAIYKIAKLLERWQEKEKTVTQSKLLTPYFYSLWLLVIPIYFQSHSTEFQQKLNINCPNSWNNQPLTELKLSEKEHYFGKEFPGKIFKASDGQQSFVFRYVTEKTRKLHSSADCYKGLGYKIEFQPLTSDKHGTWQVFHASKERQLLRIKEIIVDQEGRHWSDISKWYWVAPDSQLWTNIVIIKKL